MRRFRGALSADLAVPGAADPPSTPARFGRNVLSNSLNTVTLVVVALVGTPILVHGLGRLEYGIWVIVGSTVAYFDLFNLGFGRSSVKFVAEYYAVGDLDRVRRTLATAFIVLAVPAALALAAGVGLAFVIPTLFHIPDRLAGATTVLVIVIAVDIAFSLPTDVFGGALTALQRYDLLNATIIAVLLLQTAAWAILLSLGYGLVALGLATAGLGLAGQLARFLLARRLIPRASISPRLFDRTLMRPLAGLSGWLALADVARLVIARIDTIIVALVVGIPAAAVYAVGQKLALLAARAVLGSSRMFFPHASHLSARGDDDGLRRLLVRGTHIVMTVAVPITLVLAVLAQPALRAWVGPQFDSARLVVIYLACATLAKAFADTAANVLQGTGNARPYALVVTAEGVVNFGLSVALGATMGIAGVALATLLAAVASNVLLVLPLTCRKFGVAPGELVRSLLRRHAAPALATTLVGLYVLDRDAAGGVVYVVLLGLGMLATYALVFGLLRPRERRPRTPEALRVLLVDPSGRGGIADYTHLLATALLEAGAEPELLASRSLGARGETYPVFRHLPAPRWGKPPDARIGFYMRRAVDLSRATLALMRAVVTRQPDIVHVQAGFNRRADAWLLQWVRRRVRVVWTAHDVLPFVRTAADEGRFARIYSAADAVIVHTPPAAESVVRLCGRGASVIEHLSPTVTAIERREARGRLGLLENERVLAAVGFIRAYKGYELLAEIWEQLGAEAPLLYVLGEVIEESQHATVARLRALPRAIVRTEFAPAEELHAAIAAADAVLLPYTEASDSGILHLARALGTPVLVSDAAQLEASVTATGAGAVVPRTIEAWSQAVAGVLPPQPSPARPLVEAGRAHVALYRRLRRRRLLVYTDATETGGAERALATLVAALPDRIDVTVAGVDRRVVELAVVARRDARTLVLPPVRDKADIRGIAAHIRAVRKLRPDVFHANLRHPWSCQYGLLAAMLSRGTRIVAVEHAVTAPSNGLQRTLRKLISRHLDAHVAVGERQLKDVAAALGVGADTLRVIRSPVGEGARGARDGAAAAPVIGVLSRLSPEKGIDVLVRALPDVPGAVARIVGEGPERRRLEWLAGELGVADRVVFAGWSLDPNRELASFDVLAVPSRAEGLPLAAVEAFLARVPVVASDVGSVAEVVIDGETGLLVPSDEPAALAAALRRLLGDDRLRRELSERGRAMALELFAPEAAASRFELLYEEIAR